MKKKTAKEKRDVIMTESYIMGILAGREQIIQELWDLLGLNEKLDELEDRILRRVLYEDSE